MDPARLSEMLTNMREILLAKQTNYVNDLTAYCSMGFSRLRGLLDNPRLIQDKLGIRVIGEDQILMASGAKLNVPVPRNILYILDLTERMETILRRIGRTHWDINQAEASYATENFWKLTFNAYNRVWGRDFMQMTVLSLPPAARAKM
jgi:hypothetical protein